MWRVIVSAFAVFGMLCLVAGIAALGYMAVKTVKPEKVNKGLQQELSALGLTLGAATRAEVVARFGEPEQERQETLSQVLEYPSRGLLVRLNRTTGTLNWYEFTSAAFATARGVQVGATYQQILDAYGTTPYVTPLTGGTRVRYHYGVAYVLEFLLNKEGKLTKVSFYHS